MKFFLLVQRQSCSWEQVARNITLTYNLFISGPLSHVHRFSTGGSCIISAWNIRIIFFFVKQCRINRGAFFQRKLLEVHVILLVFVCTCNIKWTSKSCCFFSTKGPHFFSIVSRKFRIKVISNNVDIVNHDVYCKHFKNPLFKEIFFQSCGCSVTFIMFGFGLIST